MLKVTTRVELRVTVRVKLRVTSRVTFVALRLAQGLVHPTIGTPYH